MSFISLYNQIYTHFCGLPSKMLLIYDVQNLKNLLNKIHNLIRLYQHLSNKILAAIYYFH